MNKSHLTFFLIFPFLLCGCSGADTPSTSSSRPTSGTSADGSSTSSVTISTSLPPVVIDELTFQLNSDGESYSVIECDKDTSGEVVVPDKVNGIPVTCIYKECFYDCKNIVSVKLPDTITDIEQAAFTNCESLKEINLPNEINDFGVQVFLDCYSLEEIKLPENLEVIPWRAFMFCTSLISIDIPNSVTVIGEDAFQYCYSLVSVNFSKNLEMIGKHAFSFCYSLRFIDIPDSVTYIDEFAFSNCFDVSQLIVGKSVEKVGLCAFSFVDHLVEVVNKSKVDLSEYCETVLQVISDVQYSKLSVDDDGFVRYIDGDKRYLVNYFGDKKNVAVPDDITELYKVFWHKDVEKVTIPSSVTCIGFASFEETYKIKEVILPSSIKTIGPSAFHDSKLPSITLPEGLEVICHDAFSMCRFVSITLPSTLKEIGEIGFGYCPCLVEVINHSSIDLSSAYETWDNGSIGDHAKNIITDESKSKLYIENDFVKYDYCDDTWLIRYFGNSKDVVIDEGITKIHEDALDFDFIETITYPDTVTRIEAGGLPLSENLKKITLPKNLEYIDIDNFSFTFFSFEYQFINDFDGNKYIGNDDNPRQVLIRLDENATTISKDCKIIAENALDWNKATKIDVPEGVIAVMDNAFNNINLSKITLPNTLKYIGPFAFKNTKITSLDIPDSVETLGWEALGGLNSLETLSLPFISSTRYDSSHDHNKLAYLFGTKTDGKTKDIPETLKTVIVKEGCEFVGSFAGCDHIENIILPNSVKYVQNYFVEGCTSLKFNEFNNGLYLGNDTNPYLVMVGVKNKNISTLLINDNVKYICSYFLKDCDSLSFRVSEGGYYLGSSSNEYFMFVKQIDYSAKTATIHPNTKYIYSEAFRTCFIESITIPNGVVGIGGLAFDQCKFLTEVTVPDSVTYMHWYAFQSCKELTSVSLPDTLSYIPYGSFMMCPKLKTVNIPSNANFIDEFAFNDCDLIESISIPKSVKFIGGNAFSGCKALATFNYLGTISEWGKVVLHRVWKHLTCAELTAVHCSNGDTDIAEISFN